MDQVIETIACWVETKGKHYVCAADVHSIMLARDDSAHRKALRHSDMILPDGTPLVWLSKLRGEKQIERVCGPDLMLRLLAFSAKRGWRHYFYGGSEGVAQKLAQQAAALCPGIIIAGTDCPPFRPLSDEEKRTAIERINDAAPDILWVGLGCPKQERWMFESLPKLDGVVAIGVGAAFDFHSGRVKRAPPWMRSNGLEWLYRFLSEPRRLWRRYVYLAPRFLVLGLLDTRSGRSLRRRA
ncbi:MAG TPA: WecB/TagA/CpsF family glycosyltransferase [Pseudolabrys sp.]|jgi:N-acetylglucosaminyldiphosphoundecaprenol N-acetyl-beta-D-mannosaminyltransferase|nr:WecB/TagA/CpsF family glycosyltransferase [Pseudolabrys sp.]